MVNIVELIKKNKSYVIGGIIGAAGGYLYWYKVGCSTGTCPITSSPVMSTLWGLLLGALLFSIIFPNRKASPPKSDLKEMLSKGALLIDVRSRGEFAGGYAKGSKNIPLNELPNSLQQLDKEQNIVVVCASGMRSSQAVNLLKQNGFTNCYNGGSWYNFNN